MAIIADPPGISAELARRLVGSAPSKGEIEHLRGMGGAAKHLATLRGETTFAMVRAVTHSWHTPITDKIKELIC